MGTSTKVNPLFAPGIIAAPFSADPVAGHSLVNWADFNLFQAILGGEGGYHDESDILPTRTTDGVDINALWSDYQAVLAVYNQRRQTLIDILTYPVSQLIENVPVVGDAEFEIASEYGVPKASRIGVDYVQMAYDFTDYDAAIRYTWRFLRDADRRQVDAVHQAMLDADRRLVFRKVMEAVFDNRNRNTDINHQNYKVYPLYNADGMVPPPYKNTTFSGTHSHYMTSNTAAGGGGYTLIDSGDLEDAYENISHHGYNRENGTTFVAILNSREMKEVRKFRAGAVNNNTVTANYDFIPAPTQPTMIVPNEAGLLGSRPPATWNGLPVTGSYADILLIEEDYIPAGYFMMFGTGGSGNLQNIVGLREHANPAYRGLRLLPGNQQRYPLVDSYYSRGFGTGVRQRGGAVVMQLVAGTTYTTPAAYTMGGGLV
jgi:hypothetical protein